MKLLVVTGIFPPDAGGPASFVPRLVTGLKPRGVDSAIITFSDVTADPADRALQVTRISRGDRLARLSALIRALGRQGRDADVWLAQGLMLVTALTAGLMRKPLVCKVVGDGAWETAVNRGWTTATLDSFQAARDWRARLLRFWIAWPLRRARFVVTPSRYLARVVEAWGVPPGRIRVIYNATERGEPDTRPAREGRYTLITVCRMVAWKGVDGLLEALTRLPDCRLVAVGDGPELARLRNEADRLGVADRVEWTGAVSQDEVRRRLRAADAFVLNSSYEGLPHIVLEAMSEGAPVIATAVGGTPEAVEDAVTGLLIPPDQPTALVAAVTRLRTEPTLAARLTDAALARLAERFDREAMLDAYAALLDEARR